MDEEIWKSIPGFIGYEVSNTGKFRSYRHPHWKTKGLRAYPRLLTVHVGMFGYVHVSLMTNDGRLVTKAAHSIVLLAFVGPRPKGLVCCHKDGNRRNNRLSNLRWDTPEANYQDRVLIGTDIAGERNPSVKLTETDVREIRRRADAGESYPSIGRDFPVSSVSSIGNIVRRQTWSHID